MTRGVLGEGVTLGRKGSFGIRFFAGEKISRALNTAVVERADVAPVGAREKVVSIWGVARRLASAARLRPMTPRTYNHSPTQPVRLCTQHEYRRRAFCCDEKHF